LGANVVMGVAAVSEEDPVEAELRDKVEGLAPMPLVQAQGLALAKQALKIAQQHRQIAELDWRLRKLERRR